MKLLTLAVAFLFSTQVFAKGTDCKDDSQYGDVSMTEMSTMVAKKGVTIIDVNSESSFKKNRIPGAVHFASNQKKLAEVLPKDKNAPIVAYCGGKMCTAWKKAAHAACEMGYTNIRHFSEGIKGWMNRKKS